MTAIAQFAVNAIPRADGAGLAMLEDDRPQTVVATAQSSGSLGGRWTAGPSSVPRVGRLGVHSALSLPLLLPGRVVGAMNVYAHTGAGPGGAFDRLRVMSQSQHVKAAVVAQKLGDEAVRRAQARRPSDESST